MIPSRFDYVAPSTLDDAVTLLREHGGEAKVLSGGQSLIPMLKLRLAQPTVLVDINRISGLDYVEERDGALRIGALAREAELERSAVVRARYPLLFDTAGVIADPIVRNSATICERRIDRRRFRRSRLPHTRIIHSEWKQGSRRSAITIRRTSRSRSAATSPWWTSTRALVR